MLRGIRRSIALASALALALPGVTFADDISNNLDTSVDAVAEVMALNVGGANGTTQLYVTPQGDDGKPGCNLTGRTTLVINVSSSNASVATVSPSSITFTSCGDMPTLTVTPHNQGSSTISVSQTSNTTSGTFNLAPATFTVNVAPPPNTAPTISIAGVTGGASYEIGSVPPATCQVSDAEDGYSSFPATLSGISGTLAAYGIGSQTASCSYTDGGGLTASASLTYAIVDTTAPAITLVSRTPANANGWNNGDVTVTWSCTDVDGSGVVFGNVSHTVSSEGENQSASGTCQDHAGNTASATVSGINIDKTAPTISGTASPGANAFGWNNTDVVVSFTCADELSEVATCSAPATLSTEGAGQSAEGTATDRAGNTASATVSGINIDTTNPDVTAALDRAPAATGWFNATTSAPTVKFTCSDLLAGIDVCPADHMFGDGADQSYDATGTDRAGNASTAGVSHVSVDTVAPVLNVTGPASGDFEVCGGAPTRPTFDPADSLSGIASQSDSWTVPTAPSGVGTYTYTASATDVAGNATTETRTYKAIYGSAFGGFLQPINADGTSRFKLGSTVPVKFRLLCNGVPISSAIARLYVAKGDSVPDPGVDEAISTSAATTGNLFRYDASAGQYIFNLSTKLGYTNPGAPAPVSFSNGTWSLKILLDDGSWHSVNVQLVK